MTSILHALFIVGAYLDESFFPREPLLHAAAIIFALAAILFRLYYNLVR